MLFRAKPTLAAEGVSVLPHGKQQKGPKLLQGLLNFLSSNQPPITRGILLLADVFKVHRSSGVLE